MAHKNSSDSNSEELMLQYDKDLLYKQSLIKEREGVDEKYEKFYIKFMENANEIISLKADILPLEQVEIYENNLKLENEKHGIKLLKHSAQMKQETEKIMEQIKARNKRFMEEISDIFEMMQKLPETFVDENVEKSIAEFENEYRKLIILKERETASLLKIKNEPLQLNDLYEIPLHIDEITKEINHINLKNFKNIGTMRSRIADLKNNINTIKKKMSEPELQNN